ncbi:MAG: hypothetical protein JO288_21295 [Hyphomicrobiales bacterium]|nr:hypothetical protein [Hyphomicrobiales bacterium]
MHFLELLARLAADYLERTRAEERERLLMHELRHRSNNLLSVVQAIAHGSLSGSAREVFEARLLALANSNKRIIDSDHQQVPVREIVQAQIEPLASRIAIDGPDVAVAAEQAQNVGLVIHELLTNATKYGALSNGSGKVAIAWAADRSRDDALRLEWKERDGPPVCTPARIGFGTKLIKTVFPAAEIYHAPDGLCCRIKIPLRRYADNEAGFAASFR